MEEKKQASPPIEKPDLKAIRNLLIMYFPGVKDALATGSMSKAFNALKILMEKLGQVLGGYDIQMPSLGEALRRQGEQDQEKEQSDGFLELFNDSKINWQLFSNLNGAILDYSLDFSQENATEEILHRRMMFQWLNATISLILNIHTQKIPEQEIIKVSSFLALLKTKYPLEDNRPYQENRDQGNCYTPLRGLSPTHMEYESWLKTLFKWVKYVLYAVFMPGQLAEEFPEREWLIRTLNIILWITISMLIPSLISLLDGPVDDSFLPNWFPEVNIEHLSISAIELFSGACALIVVGIGNMVFWIKNCCLSIPQENFSEPSSAQPSPAPTVTREKKEDGATSERSFSLPPTLNSDKFLQVLKEVEGLNDLLPQAIPSGSSSPRHSPLPDHSPSGQSEFFSPASSTNAASSVLPALAPTFPPFSSPSALPPAS